MQKLSKLMMETCQNQNYKDMLPIMHRVVVATYK